MTYKLEDEEPFQSFPKPGAKKKSAKIKNKFPRLHDIDKPKDTHCRFCGQSDDGTCCYRHAEDPDIKFLVGGGITGGKIPDNLTVWACVYCDNEMSTRPFKKHYETQEAFTMRFYEWKNKWKLGVIKTWLI